MNALALAPVPTRTVWRLCCLTATVMLLALLLTSAPSLVHQFPALPLSHPATAPTAPLAPPTPQLPPGLGPVLNATLAADDAQDYAAATVASSPDTLRADNPAQGFATTFTTDGVRVTPASGAAISLRATAILTAGGSTPLGIVQPTSAGPRVEYRREGLTEWYINGPRGLEQDFTVAAPPSSAEQFTLGLAVDGAVPKQAADGTLLLGDLRYGDLTVTDAVGTTLPAHLDVADGNIQIAVEARGAQWPVTIDPTVTAATLTASDSVPNDGLGKSVSIATSLHTTTVVVGAPYKNGAIGAVYVFTGSGSTYIQRAKLTASDGAASDHFGISVVATSIGGIATIVVGTYRHDGFGNGLGPGKVYVFAGSGTAYPQQAILTASDNGNSSDDFGYSVAAATDGTTETVVVGALSHQRAYTFTGSGASYTQQMEFQGTGVGYSGDAFGYSVVIASAGGVNTIVVGAPYENVPGNPYVGDIWVFTGSGATYSSVRLQASDGANGDFFGASVAVATAHGQNTIVVGADSKRSTPSNMGVVYVFVGSGAAYTQTAQLIDNPGSGSAYFGISVAVGFAGGSTVIAVGANARNPQVAVALFTGSGATYTESDLPESPAGCTCDSYGTSVALMTAVNGDVAIVGGAPNTTYGAATLSYYQTTPAVNSIQATIGDGAQVVASPAGTFNGDALDLVATTFDALGNPSIPVGVTLTVNYAGAARGIFNPNDPTSTTLHTTTASTTDARSDGATPFLPVFPSDTAGAFTVTAAVDGTQLSATFHLTIVQGIPSPTLDHIVGTRTLVNLPGDTYISIYGTGFMKYSLDAQSHEFGSQVWMSFDVTHTSEVRVAQNNVPYFNSTTLGAFLDHTRLTTSQVIYIYVKNPLDASGTNFGISNEESFFIAPPAPAPGGSTAAPVGTATVLLAPGSSDLLAAAANNSGGMPLTAITSTTASLVSAGGGNLVSAGGGNLVSAGGGNLVSAGGGNLVSAGGGNSPVGGGAIGRPSSAQPKAGVAKPSTVSRSPRRNTLSTLPARNPYYGVSDANGVIFSPPITSNGIPGTYTRTVAVDGIAAPVTYTITNLDPNDGHPATISSLSRNAVSAGDPAFTLTVTGTGFVTGSVLSYGGIQLTTTVDSATHVHATVSSTLLTYTGALDVIVINPDPNGGASLPATFTVTPRSAISALTPNLTSPGSPQFTLTVKGTNFITGSTVTFNGTTLTTSFVSATQLTATVPATLVTAAGTPQVTVVDPLGGASSAVTFTIAVVNALPPQQPGGPPASGPNALPGPRQPSGPSSGGAAPIPLPPSR